MAVAFDAVGPAGGAGSHVTATPLTWTHINGASATDLLVGVAIGFATSDATATTVATYNGVSMTSLGKVHCNNQTSGYVEVFGLSSPATGSNTVSVTISGGSGAFDCEGGSVSYTGSGGFANVTTAVGVNGTGTSTTLSNVVTSAVGNMAASFCAAGTGFTATTQTLRYRNNTSFGQGAGGCVQGVDAAGAASVTLNHTYGADWSAAIGLSVVVGGSPAIPPIIVMPPRRP